MKEKIGELTSGVEAESTDINLLIEDSLITGKIEKIYGDTLVNYSFSSWDTKYLFYAYLRYLLLNASGKPVKCVFVRKSGEEIRIPVSMDKNEALKRLKKIVNIYKRGGEEIFHFSMDLMDKIRGTGVISSLRNKFKDNGGYISEINGALNAFKSPLDDPYLKKEIEKGGLTKNETLYSKMMEMAELGLFPLDEIFES